MSQAIVVTTKNGVLFADGKMLNAKEADKLAISRGESCAENLVKKLELENLHNLAVDLVTAKRAEDEAKSKRIEAEEAIASLIETGDNGSKTVDAGEGLKVVVKRKMNYKADVDAIMALDIQKLLSPLVETPPVPAGFEFDEKAYEELRENHPETFKAISKYVNATPAKVSVSLKL